MQPDINKMKVAQLKELATQFNIALPEKILKKELLELIQSHVESNFAQADENPKAEIEIENPTPEKKRRGRPPKKKPVEIPVEKSVAKVEPASESIAKEIEPVTKPEPQAKVEEVTEKAIEATNKKPTEEQSTSESADRVGGYKKNLNRKKTFYKKSEDKEKAAAENQATIASMVKSGECGKAEGLLDIQADGYGFLRALDPAQKDVYISIAQI